MAEYIEREEVYGWLVAHLPKHEERIEQIVNHVPSIDIVFCEDCKWRNKVGCALLIADDSDEPKDDDYCSYGERKEQEHD